MNREWTLSPQLDKAAQDKAWELFASFPLALLEDKRLAAGPVLAEALALRWRETEEGSFYAHIDRLDEPLLDALAYDFKVDWWDETYTLEEKRRTLKNSWRIHRMLGTKAAVELAIRAIYPETNAVEWFEYGGKPYHFRLYIDLSDVMGDETRPWHVMDRVNFYKSLRSHLDDIQFTIEAKQPAGLHVGGGAGLDATLGQREREDNFDFRDELHLGGGAGVGDTLGQREREDDFAFRDGLHLGGGFGTVDTLPQNESLEQQANVSFLRVGGVCTIISNLSGDGPTIANDIRNRVRRELGLTVSVGVSFNKVFAKLGSDMKKPNATTVITPENFRETAWRQPVSDLLYVGPATTRKLNRYGITTIGELAQASIDMLYWLLGKNGVMLHRFANGQDHSGVRCYYAVPPMKSIGNSTTAPRDLVSEDDVKITLMALCESVGARLREQNCLCSTVAVGIRDNRLLSCDRQARLLRPTANTLDIWEAAVAIFKQHHVSGAPVRSLSVKASNLAPAEEMEQMSLFPEEQKAQRRAMIDRTLDKLRRKYGYFCIRRGITLVDPSLDLDAKGEHIIHPIGFLGTLSG